MAETPSNAQIWNRAFWIGEIRPEVLKESMESHLDEAGFSRLGFTEHHFSPRGYTALWLLGESHLALHTFPENERSYVELSSCNLTMLERFASLCESYFKVVPHISIPQPEPS